MQSATRAKAKAYEQIEIEINKALLSMYCMQIMMFLIIHLVYLKTAHGTYFRASNAGIFRHLEEKDESSLFKLVINPDLSVYLSLFFHNGLIISFIS